MNQFHEKQLAICVVSANTIWVKSYAFAAPRIRKDHPASFPLSYRRICTGKGHPGRNQKIQSGIRERYGLPQGRPAQSGRIHVY